jgi:type II secretory pathway component GspD/PulD (secretin)
VDLSVRAIQIRLDVDNASFAQAMRTLSMVTNSFYVALDPHRAIVARDTKEDRLQFVRQEMETVYLPGLTQTELTDVGNLAKNVFDAPQSVIEQSGGTITIRAPQANLDAFNTTLGELLDGRSQVLLDVRLIQLAHTGERNTGVQLPQQMGVFNVYAEAQSILNANQSLVQQIIASGLASPNDYLAIIGILLASGQVSNPLLSSGFATIGGGSLSTFGLAPGATTLNLNLNSSDSRELDQLQLRLGDGEAGTLRMGTRYPIQTSSFSSLSASGVNIPGLTGAGSSSALSALLSSQSAVPPVPQVEYQDLGMTLKATPKVMRSGDVALTIEMKIDALAGASINGNPILDNRAYSGVVTLREGEAVEVVSELTKQESRAISGVPGLSEVPGLNNLTGKDNTTDYSTLLVIMTPHVIRGSQAAGHSPMMRVERGQQTR